MGSLISTGIMLVVMVVGFNLPAFGQLEKFTPARIIQTESPRYPQDRRAESRESSLDDGLVELLFMVDEKGKPFAPVVMRASMEKFVEPALVAIEDFVYQPATLDGKPVSSVTSHTMKFKITPADLRSSRGTQSTFSNLRDQGVPDGYQSYYNKFTKEMARSEPSEAKAASLLEKMISLKHQSFYGLAYHSLARFRFSERFASSEASIIALRDLIWFDPFVEDGHHVLTTETKSGIWTNLLKLQIESGQYAEALATYTELESFDAAAATPFNEYIDKINLLKSSEQATQRTLKIGARGATNIPLFKTAFMFGELSGKVNDISLRCSNRFTELDFIAESKYQVPASWGSCYLHLAGTAGSTVNLLEQ
jgi:hypothetical protein